MENNIKEWMEAHGVPTADVKRYSDRILKMFKNGDIQEYTDMPGLLKTKHVLAIHITTLIDLWKIN